MSIIAHRISDQPIIQAYSGAPFGDNINGPSLIEAPSWLPHRKARYYLYFAHHWGDHIRLALADDLLGPWRLYQNGVLHLSDTPFPLHKPPVAEPQWALDRGVSGLYPHIASPDVYINHSRQQLGMVFHGLDHDGEQRSLQASSDDGLVWSIAHKRINQTYLRMFDYNGDQYALALGGQILRQSASGDIAFGPYAFPSGHRHAGVLVRGERLHVIWTKVGDAPESLLHSVIDLSREWHQWTAQNTVTLLAPERDWEGVNTPITASDIGIAAPNERALRDPYLFETDGRVYVIYAGGGESALGIAVIDGI
ncbi:MAG: hypothetical protein ISQ21_06135 [Alphaproteobacteria bacterium]|nr:hypothetical protein [Alphaproteobacteria bacterium]